MKGEFELLEGGSANGFVVLRRNGVYGEFSLDEESGGVIIRFLEYRYDRNTAVPSEIVKKFQKRAERIFLSRPHSINDKPTLPASSHAECPSCHSYDHCDHVGALCGNCEEANLEAAF